MRTVDPVGQDLDVSLLLPRGRPTGAVLFVHGLGSDRTGSLERAQAVTDQLGAACLAFDLAGHGTRRGDDVTRVTPRHHLAELVVAHDTLAEAAGGVAVGVCGASYGAYLAALLPAERPVARLLLRAPGLYPDDELDVPLADGRRSRVVSSSRLRASARAFGGEVLVVESEHDEVIPHAVVDAYLTLFPQARREVLAGTGHVLQEPQAKQAFLALVLRWAAPHRAPAPARGSSGSTQP